MNDKDFYLRQSIQAEPLIDISNPQIHANGAKNPKMLGGPFIDYSGKRVDEIRALRDRRPKCPLGSTPTLAQPGHNHS